MTRKNSRNIFNVIVTALVLVALGLAGPVGVRADTPYTDYFTSAPFSGYPTSFSTGSSSVGLNYVCESDGDGCNFAHLTGFGEGGSPSIDVASLAYNTGTTEKVTITSRDGLAFDFVSIWVDSGGSAMTITGYGAEPFTINVSAGSSGTQTPSGGNKLVDRVEITSNDFNLTVIDTVSVIVAYTPADSDGDLTASGTVVEPVDLPSTANAAGAAVDVFDFNIVDGGTSDGLALDVSQVVLHTSGTGDFSKVVWRLDGPDASNVTAVYSAGGNTITFSSLSISVADGASETYTVNAYYSDNTGLTEGQTYILSVDGGTDLTVGGSGTQMGTTTAVNNGTGSPVDITATALVFATQPGDTQTGVAIASFTVEARDAAGNLDSSDSSTAVTLSFDANPGGSTISGTNPRTVSSGVATFDDISLDQDGIGYVFDADGGGLTTGTSDPFDIIDPEPSNHPTGFSATADSASQITTAWTDSTGGTLPDGYLVLCNLTGIFTPPVDETPQSDDADCSDGSGAMNVAQGTGTYSWTGLDSDTQYYFTIYPYTNSGANIDYKTDGTPPTDDATTPKIEPSNHPTGFSATADSASQITTAWTDSSGGTLPDGYLVLCNLTGSFTPPVDGTAQSNDADCSDGSGAMNVAHGTGTYSWTGLDSDTQYYYTIFPYSNSGANIDYKTDGTPPTDDATTLKDEPSNHPTGFSATADSASQITTAWTDSTGGTLPDGYLVLCNLTGSFTPPVDETPQSNDTDCSDGNGAMNVAHGTGTYSWTGLDSDTRYYFTIYPYSNSGVDVDYKTDGTPPTDDAITLAPDLVIAKTVTPATAAPGQTITYTLAFSNAGTCTALNVIITDSVPISVTGLSYQKSPIAITATGTISYVWRVQDLGTGEGGVITITGQLSATLPHGHTFTNTATITDSIADSNPGDNNSSIAITIDAQAPNLPTLLDPSDGTLTSTNELTLTWAASTSSDVAGYWLDLDGTVSDVGNVTEYATGVLADGTYTWTVAAYDGVGNTSAYTDVWSFTVDTIPPDAPILASPNDGAAISDTTPALTWNPSTGATGYLLDFDGTVIDVGNTTISTTGVLADGTYTWTVAAYDALDNTSAYTAVWSFTVDTAPPDVPTLLSPADGTVTSTTELTLTWAASAGAAGYLLDFDGMVTDVGDVTGSATGVLADGTYTWTVAAYDALDNTSAYAAEWDLEVDTTPPAPPVLLGPADGAITTAQTLDLTWAASVSPDVAGYLLDFDGTVMDVGDTTTYATGLLSNNTYTWTVAAYDGANNTSAYTDTWSFQVDSPVPLPPVLLSPDDGTITSTTALTLEWASSVSSGVAGYLLDWNGTVVDVGNVTAYATGVLADDTYTWTVAAYDGTYTSVYTDVWSFTIDTSALNTPPVAVDDGYATPQDTVLTVSAPGVLTNDTDDDGDSLTAVLDTGPVTGSLSLSTDGSLIYTPTAGFSGIVSFTYHANDGAGGAGSDSNVATVWITVTATPCTNVTGVTLDVQPGTLRIDNAIAFSADIVPDDATKPYNYTIDYDDGTTPVAGSSSDDPLTFSHTYTSTGTFDVTISVWNCSGTVGDAVSDTLQVEIESGGFVIYLPLVVKNSGG